MSNIGYLHPLGKFCQLLEYGCPNQRAPRKQGLSFEKGCTETLGVRDAIYMKSWSAPEHQNCDLYLGSLPMTPQSKNRPDVWLYQSREHWRVNNEDSVAIHGIGYRTLSGTQVLNLRYEALLVLGRDPGSELESCRKSSGQLLWPTGDYQNLLGLARVPRLLRVGSFGRFETWDHSKPALYQPLKPLLMPFNGTRQVSLQRSHVDQSSAGDVDQRLERRVLGGQGQSALDRLEVQE